MAADFGRDLSCRDDLDPTMREVEGLELVVEAGYRRLITPRGEYPGDPDYGDDLARFLHEGVTAAELADIPVAAAAELRKEETVQTVDGSLTVNHKTGEVAVTLVGVAAAGPFEFTMPVGSVSIELLKGVTG